MCPYFPQPQVETSQHYFTIYLYPKLSRCPFPFRSAVPSTKSRFTTKETSPARCTRPQRTARPWWTASVPARSTPVRCWMGSGSSTSTRTTGGASTYWRRGNIANPWTGALSAPRSSLSNA